MRPALEGDAAACRGGVTLTERTGRVQQPVAHQLGYAIATSLRPRTSRGRYVWPLQLFSSSTAG